MTFEFSDLLLYTLYERIISLRFLTKCIELIEVFFHSETPPQRHIQGLCPWGPRMILQRAHEGFEEVRREGRGRGGVRAEDRDQRRAHHVPVACQDLPLVLSPM